ncbi:MAG: amino acid ABC transporter substrate-binding protein [Alphaproteobacteria bacterium]|nr:amino acid ABC transporter substrate-binding protein [Alphaproteobacteria bacterium]
MGMKRLLVLAAGIAVMAGSAAAGTLDDVKAKGYLDCGINTGLIGFAAPDDKGEWSGFDVDMCRAVAVAIFGDRTKVKFTPTTGKSRFPTLASGEIDVLSRNTTWTFTRDVQLGFEFAGVNYYDGLMVRKDLGVKSATELDGASVCIQTGTTTELNLADYFKTHGMKFEPVAIETNSEARPAYEQGRCDVYTTDASGLAATRAQMDDPKAHIILPEIISKEPLGPVVRQGDDQWLDVVRWTLNAMIIAEELGVTSQNVDEMKNSPNPEVQRLLGVSGNYGEMLGLSKDWAYNIIKAIGNYGESFDRNIGPDTPIGLERGLNQLWSKGGILYAPPFR